MAEQRFHCGEALLPQGWATDVRLVLRDGLIVEVMGGMRPTPADTRLAIVMPGMPNLHSHAFQRGMAGLAETRGAGDDSFWTWRELMYRFVDRLTPDGLFAIASLAYCEMLESGFTRVGEFHYLHHDRDGAPFADVAAMGAAIVEAAAETGIGLTHLPVFYAHAGFGGTAPGALQRRFVNDLDGFVSLIAATQAHAKKLPDAIVGLAPHSLRAVTPDELSALEAIGEGGPVHIHIAEQVREVEDCIAWAGARPLEWLFDNASVDDRWCLVHATHMTGTETGTLARSGAIAGLCPITEANLGDGVFPAGAFVQAGGRFGIGSDSNVLIDATEELRLLEYGQRLVHRGRNLLARGNGAGTGDMLYRAAIDGGAQALGVPAGLVAGAAADFLSLDPAHPSLHARHGAARADGLVFAAGRTAIDGVWRRGKQVVSGGRHHAREAILRRYHNALTPLIA